MSGSQVRSAARCRHRAALSAAVVLGGAGAAVGMFSLGVIRYDYVGWGSVAFASVLAIPLGVGVAALIASIGVRIRDRADARSRAHPVRRAAIAIGALAFLAASIGGLLLTVGGWQLVLPAAAVCGCLAAGCASLVLRRPTPVTPPTQDVRNAPRTIESPE